MLSLTQERNGEIILHDGAGHVIGRVVVLDIRRLTTCRPNVQLGFEFIPEIHIDRVEVFQEKYPDADPFAVPRPGDDDDRGNRRPRPR